MKKLKKDIKDNNNKLQNEESNNSELKKVNNPNLSKPHTHEF